MRSGASYHRHDSVQDVETPRDLLDAVEFRFGKLTADLACTPENAKAPVMFCPGNGDPWPRTGVNWLNPPFGKLAVWAARCAAWEPLHGGRTLLLAPASIGAAWFADHVHGRALVLGLRPRVTFRGHQHAFPKDLVLACYGDGPGFALWKWK